MEKRISKRIIALLLTVLLLLSCGIAAFAAEADDHSDSGAASITAEDIEVLGDIKWHEYQELHKDKPVYTGEDLEFLAKDNVEYEEASLDVDVSYEFKTLTINGLECVQTPEAGTVTWRVSVPESAVYTLRIRYYPTEAKETSIERTLRINGEVPFNEVRNLLFSKLWKDAYEYDSEGKIIIETDQNHNQKKADKYQAPEWVDEVLTDPTGYYNGDFYFYFEEGENTISLQSQKEPMAVYSLTLCKYEKNISYREYLDYWTSKGAVDAPAGSVIDFEAEYPSLTSDSTLYAINDKTSSITRSQHATYTMLNSIGSTNWQNMGQWIEWAFEVENPGFYTINPRYLQNAVAGMFVSRRLFVDGKVPFEEANNLEFNYSTKWGLGPLTDGTTKFKFYFDKGVHTIRLEVNLGHFGEVYTAMRNNMTEVNGIYLKILQITGTDPDPYMDYQFYKRIPADIVRMKELSDELYALADEFENVSGAASSNSATLKNVARVLEKMQSSSETQIAKNFSALKNYIGALGTMLNDMLKQSLKIDYFIIQPEGEKLPKANGTFFDELWFEIQGFVSSFVYDGYSFASNVEGEEIVKIDVWTTVSREYTQLIRDLIDSSFSEAYPNISANLKLVTMGTVLPATLAGVGPDVMMNEPQTTVIDYAVRGAVLDLSGYEGFDELISRFTPAAMVPLTVALGSPQGDLACFGIPMTQSFNAMFYRKDVLAELGLDVPKSWDELVEILPKLQSQNYTVGMSTKAACTNLLYTFIYQHGGQLFVDNGLGVSFDDKTTLEAFTHMCSLYTDYSFPISYDAANRFRTGEYPIIVADYITFYNQFTIYATELKGLWGFTNIPGYNNPDGTINNSTMSSVSAMVLMSQTLERGTAEAGFKFMEWWMRSEVQSAYANQLIALLGPAGKYATANTDAFNAMSWTSSELKSLNLITKHLVSNNEMPGSYIISRYVTFAFMDVYNNRSVAALQLMSYVQTINEEMARKRQELSRRQFYVPDRSSKDKEES